MLATRGCGGRESRGGCPPRVGLATEPGSSEHLPPWRWGLGVGPVLRSPAALLHLHHLRFGLFSVAELWFQRDSGPEGWFLFLLPRQL